MKKKYPISPVIISEDKKEIIKSQVGIRFVRGINSIICRDPFVVNELFIRKILKGLQLKNTQNTSELIFCKEGNSTNSVDINNINLFISNAISFTGLSKTSQQAIKEYMNTILEQEKYRVISLENGEIQDYIIHNNQCYWQKNQVRVIDLITVLFSDNAGLLK